MRLVPLAVGAALVAGAALGPSADATPRRVTYLVTLAPGSAAPRIVAATAAALGGQVRFVYSHALRGFAVELPVTALAVLRHLPGVQGVSPDQPIQVAKAGTSRVTTQNNPGSYGLDRIDQRNLPLSHSYRFRSTGSGVTAYIVDTGIRVTHRDFGGRAVLGYDAVGGGASDCNGHGTHVAGTLGGKNAGVAKAVRLVAVRVLDCNGSGGDATVVAGLDWVVAHHQKGQPAVINMSLGGGASSAVDQAVQGAIDNGITVAVAAGNDGGALLGGLTGQSDACHSSPSRVPGAITVGATDSNDAFTSYSDYGRCVDLLAPGDAILSDWFASDTAQETLSGTSMATPHAAGVAALYLARHPSASPASVESALTGHASQGVVTGVPSGTANRLLFTDY